MKDSIKRTLCTLLALVTMIMLMPIVPVSAGYEDYVGGMQGDGNGIIAQGVDLSDWQGSEVDFNLIKGAGYDYVILRAGFARTEDKTFEGNYARAKAAGLDVGVYLYSYADTKDEVLQEAAALKTWLKGKQLDYPVYFDLEDPETHGSMSVDALTGLALTFLDDMAADGWLVGLYSCKSWLDYKMDTGKICAKYECWMAQYLSDGSYDLYDRYDEVYGMWQYSSSGSVDGVPGGVDMDVCFKDYPSICREYGFNGYEATGETLTLSGAAVPDVITYGENFKITGKVATRVGQLTNVTVGFYDADGTMLLGRSAGPKDTSYDISKLSSDIKTKELAEGRYFFRVSATNTAGTKTLLDHEVVVAKSGVRLDSCKAPQDMKTGQSYAVNGMITAMYDITGVEVRIDAADGKNLQKTTAAPNSTDYDLSALADRFNFAALTPGSYRYVISAKTSKGSQELLSAEFRVWVKDDPITVAELSLRQEYYVDMLTQITGTVSSQNSDFEYVTVEIHDRNDEVIRSGEVTDAGRSAELEEIALDLNDLPVGTYYCVITACNAAGPAVAERKRFIVRNDAISLCSLQAPENLLEGDSFSLQGVIVSEDSALQFVSVTVTDQNSFQLLSAADIPASACFDLSSLNDDLRFSSLHKGNYTLRITAENEHNSTELLRTEFSVTHCENRVRWASEHVQPDAIAYSAVNSLGLFGILISDPLPIEIVSLEVINSDGQTTTSAYLYPDENELDISYLNQYVHLSALPCDDYRMKITASNAAGSFVMLNAPFTLSECPHGNVVSGKTFAATCTCAGAISDSYCLDCGRKVRSGQTIAPSEHDYLGGICTACGRAEYLIGRAIQSAWKPVGNSRIVIAFHDGEKWYALNANGECVSIDKPDTNGEITVSAELLWEPVLQRDGTVALRNNQGKLLHLDSEKINICFGRENTRLLINADGQTSYISCGDRFLSCKNGIFCVGMLQTPIFLFFYLTE